MRGVQIRITDATKQDLDLEILSPGSAPLNRERPGSKSALLTANAFEGNVPAFTPVLLILFSKLQYQYTWDRRHIH